MREMWYNTGVINHINSRGMVTHRRGLGNCVGGTATMSHHTPKASAFKTCTKCGESKPTTEFHKGGGPGGLRSACKLCTNAQNRGIYYQNRDAHLEAKRQYRSECYDTRLATVREYDARNADKRQAHRAVKKAIKVGVLPRASECACIRCGGQADIYHHDSYEIGRWLDVAPLCRTCHGELHRAN